MNDIEGVLRRTLSSHLDSIDIPRSLPPSVRVRARRGRALMVAAAALGAAAIVSAAVVVIPSLGRSGPQLPIGVDRSTSALNPPKENGRIAYSLSGNGVELRSMEPDGSDDERIPTPSGLAWLPSWSPDGTRLAVTIFQTGGSVRAIWVMDADGSRPRRLAVADGLSAPSWSPDGTTLAFSASYGGNTSIHSVNADGSNYRTIHEEPAEGTFQIFSASYSPDGTEILFDRGTDSGFDIFVMDVDDNSIRRLTTTGTDYDPSWSPDGTEIAFTREESVERDGRPSVSSDIFVMDADGDNVRRLTDDGVESTNLDPEWAPDGTAIAYVAGVTGGPGGLVVMNADGSDPTVLVEDGVLGVSWQPRPVGED